MDKLPFFSDSLFTENIGSNKLTGEVVADGLFYIPSAESSQLKLVLLCGNTLVQYQDHTKTKIRKVAQLNFDTRFLMIIEESSGKFTGIKFDKEGHEPETLLSSNQELMKFWKNNLEQKINERGFHELFKPIKKIGKGNFASVYLAQRKEDGRMVAVKAFSKQLTFSQQKGKQSLINEIKLLRKLNHSNILKLYAVFESQNSIYMTLELLEGGQLYDKIQSRYKFTVKQIQNLMRNLLEGIKHMSDHRIMHRDLKPQNIMLRDKNTMELVIADFGLATWAEQPEYLFVRCGTPGYVAPEIINLKNLKAKSDPICDMFSAGLIFHIFLFGKSIFPGKNYNDVLAQNRACDYDLNTKQYDDLPTDTHQLLKRMLDKNPLTRISANQALKHPYFKTTMMEVEQFTPSSPLLKKLNSNQNSPLVHNQPLGDKTNYPALSLKYKPSIFQNINPRNQSKEPNRKIMGVKSRSKYKENY